MWITIPADAGADRLTDTEERIYRQRFLGAGKPDPLPEILEHLAAEIRGRVAANTLNRVDSQPGTIPANLMETARAIARYRLLTRLPADDLVTESRRAEYKDALKLLDDVARGTFIVDQPDDPGEDQVNIPTPSISARERRFTRDSEDGI